MKMRLGTPLLAALLLSSCASTPAFIRHDAALGAAAGRVDLAEKVAERDSLTWDKTKKKLDQRPWLAASREDSARLARLDALTGDGDKFKSEAGFVLDSMAARAGHLYDLSAKGLAKPTDMQALGTDLYALAQAERDNLDSLKTEKDRRDWLEHIRSEVPSKTVNGGRGWRMAAMFPAVPFLYTWIANHATTEDRGPYPHEFEKGIVYSPPTDHDAVIAARLTEAKEEQLLQFYAPIVVQQRRDDVTYDETADRLGRAEVYIDAAGHVMSRVNPATPTVYSYSSQALLAGEWHRQVNYQLWYPEHPAQASFDPESGHTEGVLIRITLDLENRPLLAETVFACGCFHRIFPVDALEKEATETDGAIVSGRSALARNKSFAIDPYIPQTMGDFDINHPHPCVYVYGGKHFAGAVEYDGPLPAESETATYELKDAEELEELALPDGRIASFFQRDGLVRGADRSEAKLLWGTGLYHPGTPRIRGEHLIHFDEYDYDDPTLLEQLLRFPAAAFLRRIETSPYAKREGSGPAGTAPSSAEVPRAKKKAQFCPC